MMAQTDSGSKCTVLSCLMNILEIGGSKCSVGATTYQQANMCVKQMYSFFRWPRYENVQEANVHLELPLIRGWSYSESKCSASAVIGHMQIQGKQMYT